MFSPLRFRPALPLAALVAVAAAGCGEKPVNKVTVSGSVTHQGQPLTGAMLRAVGAGGEFAASPLAPDGTFTLTDVPVGEVKVGFMLLPQSAGSSGSKSAAPAPKAAPPLPAKYRDPQTSGLTYTVDRKTRELKIDIN